MASVSKRMINRLIGRPSLVKSLLCSFLLHSGAICGTYFWSSKPINHFSLAGQHNAIYVEATFSTSQPYELVETFVEFQEATPPDVDDHDPATKPVAMLDLAPQKLPLRKREVTVDIKRPIEIDAPVTDTGEFLVHVGAPRRRAGESRNTEIKPVDAPSPRPRRVVEVPSPRPAIAVKQVPGVENKTPPDFSGNRPPSYPVEAIRRRLEGTVLLRLHIAASGRIERVEIVETSGHVVLDRAAVQAVRTWRGRPAHRAGQPVATVELLPVRFRFRE